MSSFVWAGVRSVGGKITRSALVTRTSRPPASIKVSWAAATVAEHDMARWPGRSTASPSPSRADDLTSRLEIFRADEDGLRAADGQAVGGSGSAVRDAVRAVNARTPQEPAEDLCLSFGRDDVDGNE